MQATTTPPDTRPNERVNRPSTQKHALSTDMALGYQFAPSAGSFHNPKQEEGTLGLLTYSEKAKDENVYK